LRQIIAEGTLEEFEARLREIGKGPETLDR
jgi:hypothetical protein